MLGNIVRNHLCVDFAICRNDEHNAYSWISCRPFCKWLTCQNAEKEKEDNVEVCWSHFKPLWETTVASNQKAMPGTVYCGDICEHGIWTPAPKGWRFRAPPGWLHGQIKVGQQVPESEHVPFPRYPKISQGVTGSLGHWSLTDSSRQLLRPLLGTLKSLQCHPLIKDHQRSSKHYAQVLVSQILLVYGMI